MINKNLTYIERNTMKKRIIIAIGLTVALSMTGCASKEITQTKTETTVELGSECTIIPTDYFELGSKVNPDTIAVDTSAVDTNTVGEYVAVVTYNDSTYEIKVSVSDTTAPEISAKTDITPVDRGTTIYPADYVEVNDLSEVAVYFVAEDGDNESLEIPSDLDNDVTEINYTVVAVDAESNRSEELSVAIPIFTFKQGEIEGEALPIEEEPTEEAEKIDLIAPISEEEQKEIDELNEILTQDIDNYRQLSPYAGKTSKHGWAYPDDYIEYGTRAEDIRGDLESMFDEGLLSEEDYQACVKVLEESPQPASPEKQQSMDDVAKKIVEQNTPSTGNTGSTGNSNAAPIELPEGPTYEKTGRICY